MRSCCQSLSLAAFVLSLAGCNQVEFNFVVVGDPNAVKAFAALDDKHKCVLLVADSPFPQKVNYEIAESVRCRVQVELADGRIKSAEPIWLVSTFGGVDRHFFKLTATYNVDTDTLTTELVDVTPPKASASAKQPVSASKQTVSASKQTANQALQVLVHFLQVNIQSPDDILPVFEEMDADGSGGLSLAEVKAAVAQSPEPVKGKYVKKGFRHLEETYGDGDGELQLEELVDAYLAFTASP